jgi:hypothetical protein
MKHIEKIEAEIDAFDEDPFINSEIKQSLKGRLRYELNRFIQNLIQRVEEMTGEMRTSETDTIIKMLKEEIR